MNRNTILKLGAMLLVLLMAASLSAFAQGLATVYVDVTNGSDTYTGANPTNSPAGTGPKASINAGLAALANNGTLVIFAGTYNGGNNAGGDVNINTTTYSQLTSGLTIEVRQLGGNNEVRLSAGNFIFDVAGGTLTVTTTSGTEFFNIANANLTLGSATRNSTIAIASSASFRIRSGGTITINGTSAFSNQAPQKGTNLSLVYSGGGSFTAGPEAAYGSYGNGTLTVNKSAGTTVTFPAAMTFTGFATGTADNADNVIVVSGGDAVFSGAITIGNVGSAAPVTPTAGDINASGSSNVTFNGAVTMTVLGQAAQLAGDISNVENTGTGTVAFNGAVTWNAAFDLAANTTFASGAGTSLVRNTAAGSITFGSTVTLATSAITADDLIDIAVNVDNTAGGTISFAQPISAPTTFVTTSTKTRKFVVNATNAGAGSLTISGTLRGSVVNSSTGSVTINGATTISGNLTNTAAASGTITISAATTVAGVLTNGAGKTIALGANTLTLSGSSAHLTNGGTITATTGGLSLTNTGAASFNGGTLSNITKTSGAGSVTFQTNAITVTSLSQTAGTVVVDINVTASSVTISGGTNFTVNTTRTLRTTNFTQTGGTFTLAAGTSVLRVDGDFNRTAGTFTANPGSTLTFQGSGNQAFNGGPLLQVDNLTFTNISGTITLGQSVRASGAVTISAGTNLALGTLNIILNSATASMTNAGSYTASGGGGVVLGGITTIGFGGFSGNGITISASGTGVYSFITVDVGSGNTASITTSNTRFTGTLTLATGTLDVDGVDFGPSGSSAKIVRNVETSDGITTSNSGTFNASAVPYDLEYIGTLTADRSTGSELNANARSWTVNVTGDNDADGDFTTGTQYYVEIPGSANFTFAGPLTVGRLALVRIASHANNVNFELSGTGVTHTIRGRLTTADASDYILVSGANVNIVGSAATEDDATIGNIQISSTTGCTITNIQGFLGTFTTNANSVVSLGMGSSDAPDATTLASEQQIAGAVTLGGASLTLTSNIEALAGVAFNAGTINFGVYNLQLTTAGDFVQGGGASGYTTSGGFLVMNRNGANLTIGNTSGTALPNLRILANTTLAAAGRVSGILDIGVSIAAMPTLTIGNNNLTFSGTAINVNANGAGTAVRSDNANTASGRLLITGTAVTITANTGVTIEELDFNPGGAGTGTGTLTFASTSATTGRTFIISDQLTTVGTAPTIATGINVLSLRGDAATPHTLGANTLVTSSGAGWLELNGSAAGILSTVTSSTTRPVVQKLRIAASATLTATHRLRVTNALDLTAGTFTVDANLLELGDGTNPVAITRRLNTAMLANAPTFTSGSAVDVSYVQANNTGNADITMGNEAPSSIRNLTINNQDADSNEDNVNLNANKTVTGTLFLVAGELDVATFTLTMAPGATINRSGGRFETTGGQTDAPTVTTYNLIYSTGAAVTAGTEFRSGIINLTVQSDAATPPNPTILTLGAAATLTGNLTLNSSGGGINLNGRNLTVQGNVTVTAGSFTNGGGTAELVLAGSSAQTITVPSTGLTLPININLRLNNAAGFTLTGGNLIMSTNPDRTAGNTIFFVNGVLSTGSNVVVLAQTTTGQGFDRSGVTGTNKSHIFGTVRHSIPAGAGSPTVYQNGRFEFPVGSLNPEYRPFAINFASTYPASTPTNIDVTHVDASPEGIVGLPVTDASTGKRIGSYPNFYWLVRATTSLGAAQAFDVEVVGTKIGRPFTRVDDLRIIRRFDGSADINPWSLQGAGANYSNILEVGPGGDSTVTVRNTNSTGGIVTQGARFTIGIPTRPPSFTVTQATATVNENSQLSLQYTAVPNDVGETVTYSLSTSPAISTNPPVINATTGLVTWTPNYAQAGTYTFTVTANDGEFNTTTTTTVTVVNVNRKPTFTAIPEQTVTDGQTLSLTLAATDPDGDPLTYSFVSITPSTGAAASVNPTVTAAGALSWSPAFADAGRSWTIRVAVTDNVTTGAGELPGRDSLNISVNVNRSVRRGDANLNGQITISDASRVLEYVVGLYTPPAADLPRFNYAADANANGIISALDASRILLFLADSVNNPLPSTAMASNGVSREGYFLKAAAGSLQLGQIEAARAADAIKIPMLLSSDAKDVYSVEFSMPLGSGVEVKAVTTNLPDGWLSVHSVSDGVLKVALAGPTAIGGRELATVTIGLKDKESRYTPTVVARLNDNPEQSLMASALRAIPTEFALQQNYPNPFNPSTTIKYQLAEGANVVLEIYNLAGQKVRTLVNERQEAGYYSVVWDGVNDRGERLASGMYFYRINAGKFAQVNKMVMLK